MKRILALTDFSEVANYAVESATEFARKHHAELQILHVLSSTDHIQYELDADPELFIRNRKGMVISAKMDTWKSNAIASGVTTHMIISAGELVQQARKIVVDQQIDLVVMGSTGLDESEKLWGTVTQEVARNVDVPILVIKSKMKDYRMDNIVFASDFDAEDREAMTQSISLLKPPSDAIIHLMSVNTASFFTQPRVVMNSALKDFQELALPYRTTTNFHSDYSVDAGIRHFIVRMQPDVLIMSNRKRNPIVDFFLSSPAINAIGSISAPVLIVK